MSFLESLAGNAAITAEGLIGSRIAQNNALEQEDRRSANSLANQKSMAQLHDELAASRAATIEAMRVKPQNDFSSAVASHMGGAVPMEPPAPVTQTNGITDRGSMTGVNGKPIQSAGAGDIGLRGNIAKLRMQIINTPGMSAEDRRGALAQLDAQAAQENQAAAMAVPKSRDITQSEAIDLAMNDMLKSGNGPAYAYGKTMATDKTLSVPDGGAIIDPKTGRVIFQNTGKADRQMAHEDFQANQQQTRLDAQEKLKRLEIDPLGINAAAAGGVSGASTAIANGATGPDLLKAIPPHQAEMVKALAEGRMSFPQGAALKSPVWQGLITLVGQYDPTFDAVNYGSRSAARKDFTSGKSSQSANALNTVLGHLESLGAAADELNNTSVPLWNTLANSMSSGMGDPRVKKFEATKKAVVDELTRAWRGSGGAVSDIESWSKTLDAAGSPEQLHGVVGQLGELLESKIEALNDQYKKGMGTTAGGLTLMSPHAANVLQTIRKRAGMDAKTSPTGSQQSGGVLTYDPATGGFH